MKLLIFTTLYDMQARPDLVQDTSAIHYLLKHLSRDHEILVINTYLNRKKYLYRYLDPRNAMGFFRDFCYEKDGVRVRLFETQVINTYFGFPEWQWMAYRSKRILEREKFVPDLVISHFPSFSYGFIDKIGLTCPRIGVLHGTDLIHADHRETVRRGLGEKYDALFCRSREIYEHMRAWGLPNLRPEIIYSGTILPDCCQARHFRGRRELTVIYAGKLQKQKNIDWTLRCLARGALPGARLWLVGAGPDEGRLRALAKKEKLEDRVTFFGRVSREKVQALMGQADIFCMPSKKETFGLVYLEAMACGCITIGSRNEGIDGVIVDGENGCLVTDEENLLACFRRIAGALDSGRLEALSQRAMETGREFSEENMSRRYFALMRSVYDEKRREQNGETEKLSGL